MQKKGNKMIFFAYKILKSLVMIPQFVKLVLCYVYVVERGISLVQNKTFICFCKNAQYKMQL